MKHDIIRADVNTQKMGFLFECKYFDRKGDLNKIEKFSSGIKDSKENSKKIFLSNNVSSRVGL